MKTKINVFVKVLNRRVSQTEYKSVDYISYFSHLNNIMLVEDLNYSLYFMHLKNS